MMFEAATGQHMNVAPLFSLKYTSRYVCHSGTINDGRPAFLVWSKEWSSTCDATRLHNGVRQMAKIWRGVTAQGSNSRTLWPVADRPSSGLWSQPGHIVILAMGIVYWRLSADNGGVIMVSMLSLPPNELQTCLHSRHRLLLSKWIKIWGMCHNGHGWLTTPNAAWKDWSITWILLIAIKIYCW